MEHILPYKIDSSRRKHYKDIQNVNTGTENIISLKEIEPPKFIRNQFIILILYYFIIIKFRR